jgi:transposase
MTPAPSSTTATSLTIRPSWCRSLARLGRAPRSPSRPPTAGGGWSSCWRSWSWSRTWCTPAAARQSPRPGCRNDKVDAATLAQLLRADLLPEAWIAPQQVRDLRALLRHRAALVRLSTSGKNRVHAVLADRGIRNHSSLWTGPGRAWLAGLALPPTPRGIIEDCCGLLDALATPIGRLEREIDALAKPDPRVQALMVLPGVGKLTAMTLVAEIGDIARFSTARKLCAWAGLTPQVRNSDRTVRHGHITKQGSPWCGGSWEEAAQTAKRHPVFASAYGELARRRGKNIATVAIARRLLARSFTSCPSWRKHRHRRRPLPGALAFPHEPATRPPGLTEQPGSGLTVMRTPPSGPEWVHASQLRNPVRAFSLLRSRHHHNPVIHPAPSQGRSRTPLTRPDPMGAQTQVHTAVSASFMVGKTWG